MLKKQKIAWFASSAVAVIIAIGLTGREPSTDKQSFDSQFGERPSFAQSQTPHGQPLSKKGEREVRIYDHGLNMVMSTIRLPADWSVQQDIAYNPNGGLDRFKLVMIGPRNQYIRNYAGTFPYGSINNLPFDHALRQAIDHVIMDEKLQNVRFGELLPNRTAEQDSRYRDMVQRMNARGQRVESYFSQFTGERDGKSYRGRISFANVFQPQGGFGILQPSALIFSLAEDFPELEQTAQRLTESLVPNLQHHEAMVRIGEMVRQRADAYSRQMMDQSAVAHQKRMADREAAFASHQKNMAGLNQLQDVAHESYMRTLRSSGSFSTVGSDYTSHNAFVDQIHERSTFQDPWAESPIHLEGQYRYNFTNGLGDYYRTNDASFDPASLQGDWRSIDPLNP